jgi:hypothetical protein
MIAAISGDELRKALVEVEKAEAAGFVASQAVFNLTMKNGVWGDGEFTDVCEKAHPTNGALNWGRDNFMVRQGFTFRDGRLLMPPHAYNECKQDRSVCQVKGKHCIECGKTRKLCAKAQAA